LQPPFTCLANSKNTADDADIIGGGPAGWGRPESSSMFKRTFAAFRKPPWRLAISDPPKQEGTLAVQCLPPIDGEKTDIVCDGWKKASGRVLFFSRANTLSFSGYCLRLFRWQNIRPRCYCSWLAGILSVESAVRGPRHHR
jgi:hypothetical protein